MQDKVLLKTQKATERTFEFTRKVIEKSKKLQTPSAKVDEIGVNIGFYTGSCVFVGGILLLFTENSRWSFGTLVTGGVIIMSNRIYDYYRKHRK